MRVMAPLLDREASRQGQGDAGGPQSCEDIGQITFDASPPGHQTIQRAAQPAGSSGDVTPESKDVARCSSSRQATRGAANSQPRGAICEKGDLVSKEIKAFVDTTDKATPLMQAKTHRCCCLVEAADRRPQMPPGSCQHSDVVLVPNIMDPSVDNMAAHGVIQRQQVEGSQQRYAMYFCTRDVFWSSSPGPDP